MNVNVSDLQFADGYWPGVIGDIAAMHARYYHQHWRFGAFFEARVATDLARFVSRYDPRTDRLLTARAPRVARDARGEVADGDMDLAGSIAIDGADAAGEGAHLRWFIVSLAQRGQGLGQRLLGDAMDFCRAQGYPRVYLWTFAGLDAARALYERHGFELAREFEGDQWGRAVTEQRFEWRA